MLSGGLVMIFRGQLISTLMGAILLAGCAWQGGPSQPVQPVGQQQAAAPKSAAPATPAPTVQAQAPAAQAPAQPAANAVAPSPAPAGTPAMMKPADLPEVVGSWQMVQLPPAFLQPTNAAAPLNTPWQWFIFSPVDATGMGRIGLVIRADAPRGIVTDRGLAEAWSQSPMFDTYRMTPGVVSVTPVTITGWSAQGTQAWQTYIVTTPGLMLGMQAIPGDMLMVLTGAQNQPLYYRMLRRVARAAQ